MDKALEDGWLMEAVTIQESIISGRLLAVLARRGIEVQAKDPFSSLIDRFHKFFANEDSSVSSVCQRLHEWRKQRNHVLHSVCRNIEDPYDVNSVDKFEDLLIATARDGRVLVNEVRNTVARLIRRMEKSDFASEETSQA